MNFWAEVSQNIENLLDNHITINNEDLLEDLPEIAESRPPLAQTPLKINLKSSWLYHRFQQKHQLKTHDSENLSKSSTAHATRLANFKHKRNKSSNFADLSNEKIKPPSFLSVTGRKAAILLPKILKKKKEFQDPSETLKDNLKKIKLKYKIVCELLKSEEKFINKEKVLEYFNKNNKAKSNTNKKIKCNIQGRPSTKKHIRLPHLYDICEYSQNVLKKAEIFMVSIKQKIFDPCNFGQVSENSFYTVLLFFHHMNRGIDKFNFFSIDLLKRLKRQVKEHFAVFSKFSSNGLIELEGLKQLFKEKFRNLNLAFLISLAYPLDFFSCLEIISYALNRAYLTNQ